MMWEMLWEMTWEMVGDDVGDDVGDTYLIEDTCEEGVLDAVGVG